MRIGSEWVLQVERLCGYGPLRGVLTAPSAASAERHVHQLSGSPQSAIAILPPKFFVVLSLAVRADRFLGYACCCCDPFTRFTTYI
jgi:hypothetical protein